MTHHINATITRRLLFSFFFIALSAVALPALSAGTTMLGCTVKQVQSREAKACIEKGEKDLLADRPDQHAVVCISTGMKCCIIKKNNTADTSKCEDLPGQSPPKPDIVCADQKAVKGIWQKVPNSIKAHADKKSCSQDYACSPPVEFSSEIAANCKPVISASHKTVTQDGLCVQGKEGKGPCDSCLGEPHDPCNVTFVKK
jgi:hypothetical protein